MLLKFHHFRHGLRRVCSGDRLEARRPTAGVYLPAATGAPITIASLFLTASPGLVPGVHGATVEFVNGYRIVRAPRADLRAAGLTPMWAASDVAPWVPGTSPGKTEERGRTG